MSHDTHKKTKTKDNKTVKHDVFIVMAVVGLAFAILFYPAAANWVNARAHAEEMAGWAQTISAARPAEIAELLESAEQYNERLAAGLEGLLDETDPAYLAQLRKINTRVISRVVIPDINVALPVFHGTGDDVLEIGVGHLYGTSLPVGNHDGSGFGTHSVITAHSGINTNSLFNDLHDLVYGNVFMVETAGRHLFYRVDQITVVDSEAIKRFTAEPGEDVVTLLTCTPIGINSHRLLVRGSRYHPEAEEAQKVIMQPPPGEQFPMFALFWAGPVIASGGITHALTKGKPKSFEG